MVGCCLYVLLKGDGWEGGSGGGLLWGGPQQHGCLSRARLAGRRGQPGGLRERFPPPRHLSNAGHKCFEQ